MTDTPIIAVGGENLIDYVDRDGATRALPGGSPFNVAMAIGRLGGRVRYASPISSDDWGGMLAGTLEDSGVDLTGGRRDLPTTMARVLIRDGIPEYRFERDGTAERDVTANGLRDAIGADAAAVHIGSLALTLGPDAAAWEEAIAHAHAAGRVISLDPNLRLSVIGEAPDYPPRLFRMARMAHVLKLSDEDLAGLYPGEAEAAAMARLRAATAAPLVVLTRGARGVLAWLGETRVEIPAPPVPGLVDTVGAGDTFTGALLTAIADAGAMTPAALSALTAAQAEPMLRRAGMAAAINCAREGCSPPTRAELDARF